MEQTGWQSQFKIRSSYLCLSGFISNLLISLRMGELYSFVRLLWAVLSDHKKRTIYDAGLYDPEDEDDEVGILEI